MSTPREEEEAVILASVVSELKRLGRFTKFRFVATPKGSGPPGLFGPPLECSGVVDAIDRRGIWLILDDAPTLQQLWPDEKFSYSNFLITPTATATRARPVEEEEETSPRRARQRAQPREEPRAEPREDLPRPAAAVDPEPAQRKRRGATAEDIREDELARFEKMWQRMKERKKRARRESSSSSSSSSSDDSDKDSDIRDIVTGDKGVMVRLVANLKIPIHPDEEHRWMYLYAHETVEKKGRHPYRSMSADDWRKHALAFQLKYSNGYKNVALSDEAENIIYLLTEVMEFRKQRNTKREWVAVFSFVARFVFLVLLSSNMAGLAAAQHFSQQFDACINNKDSKIELAELFTETLRFRAKPEPTPQPPVTEPAVPISQLTEKIDGAVKKLLDTRPQSRHNFRGKKH
jgi:hypothetical protein